MKEFHKFKIFKAIINLTTESDKRFKFKLIIYPDIENKNIAINNYNSHTLQFTNNTIQVTCKINCFQVES